MFPLDEPLSNLDAQLRVQTRTEISKLHQRLGTTFIYVTHDQVEAMTMASRIAVMRDGLVQQVGSPQELYSKPDNIFVAGFIGSPAMNFFDVTLTGTAEEMTVDGESFQAVVPPEQALQLIPYLGERVMFGIRPENIHDNEFPPPGILTSPLRARVDVTELMGNEIFLHVVNGKHELLARVDPRTEARAGRDVDLVLDMSNMHAFDPVTERALLM